MRCKACNKKLDDTELTKKDPNGDYIDLCYICLSASFDIEIEGDIGLISQYYDLTEDY